LEKKIAAAMGPERVLPSSEDELGEDERPADGTLPPGGGAVWSGGEGGGEEEEEGGEEDENENSGGYYYQPLNQDPDGGNATEEVEPRPFPPVRVLISILIGVLSVLQVMGLHLPEAPPLDSDDEDDPEGAAALRSHASIPMDADHVELVKRTMAAVALPVVGVPAWAQEISDDQWKDMVQHTLQGRQSAGALRLSGP
uniref:Male-enhanced antigen 1 n=1 Tax=Scophthalmus maximus TaxID=52904 RepID=A0A8D3DTT6_SCOMX